MKAPHYFLSESSGHDHPPAVHRDSLQDIEAVSELVVVRHGVREAVLALHVGDGLNQD